MILLYPFCTVYVYKPEGGDQYEEEEEEGEEENGFQGFDSYRVKRQSSFSCSSPSTMSTMSSHRTQEDMQRQAMEVALQAMAKHRVEKDIATYIKEEFDRRFQPSWHCVVGRNFGSFVTHETNHFIYFYIQHVAIMLFKTGF